MFKKIALTTILTGLMTISAQSAHARSSEQLMADANVCEAQAGLATQLMAARQNGYQKSDVMAVSKTSLARNLIHKAYALKVEELRDDKVKAVVDFSMKEFNRCMEEYKNADN